MEIWHNPRCTKSRQTKERLDDAGVDYVERRYLDDPPTVDELGAVLDALGLQPDEIVRRADARKMGLDLDALGHDRAEWLQTMVDNPIIIERPIVIADDGRAVVGRPPENVDRLLG